MHHWYSTHSPRTQHCNVCRESIPALSRNVIICEGTFLIPLGIEAKSGDRSKGARVGLVSLTHIRSLACVRLTLTFKKLRKGNGKKLA